MEDSKALNPTVHSCLIPWTGCSQKYSSYPVHLAKTTWCLGILKGPALWGSPTESSCLERYLDSLSCLVCYP